MNELLNGMLHYLLEDDCIHTGVAYCKIGKIPDHWHDYYEFEFVTEGEGQVFINGIAYTLEPGMLFLITPTDFHSHHFTKVSYMKVVSFTDSLLEQNSISRLRLYSGYGAIRIPEKNYAWINSLFDRLIYERDHNDSFKLDYISHVISQLLIEFARRSKNVASLTSTPFNEPMQNATHYIHIHFRENLTLDMVSQYVGFSSNYFSSEFHKATGLSFKKYLTEQRLSYAITLLKVTSLSITEIAEASGFNSISYFLNVFHKKFGMTPKEYKKTVLKGKQSDI